MRFIQNSTLYTADLFVAWKKITKMVKKLNRYLFALEQKTLLFAARETKSNDQNNIWCVCVQKVSRALPKCGWHWSRERERRALFATCNKNVNCRIYSTSPVTSSLWLLINLIFTTALVSFAFIRYLIHTNVRTIGIWQWEKIRDWFWF